MCSINATSYLWKAKVNFKTISHLTKLVALWNINIVIKIFLVTTSHVCSTISPTVDLPNLKTDSRVQYSTLVASFRTVTATLSSILTGDLMFVFCKCGFSLLHRMLKMSLVILKFASTNYFQVCQTEHHETHPYVSVYTKNSTVFSRTYLKRSVKSSFYGTR